MVLAAALWTAGLPASAVRAASMIETIKARGYLNGGVAENAPGFSEVDDNGQWRGLDVEFCLALAAAVFSEKTAMKFRAMQAADRFKALQEGEIDVLLRATGWTMSRDSDLGVRFTATLFYDGQGFLVPRNHAVSSVLELSGASICVLPGMPVPSFAAAATRTTTSTSRPCNAAFGRSQVLENQSSASALVLRFALLPIVFESNE